MQLVTMKVSRNQLREWIDREAPDLSKRPMKKVSMAMQRLALDRLNNVVSSFKIRPHFEARHDEGYGFVITTDDRLFHWLDKGTKLHVIEPNLALRVRSGRMQFGMGKKGPIWRRGKGTIDLGTGEKIGGRFMSPDMGKLRLVFKVPYHASTQPGKDWSGPASTGSFTVRAKQTEVKIDARNFSDSILREIETYLPNLILNEITEEFVR